MYKVYGVVYGIIVILDHQNIGVDITTFHLLCLAEEIWRKIQNLVIEEGKMVAMNATKHSMMLSMVSLQSLTIKT